MHNMINFATSLKSLVPKVQNTTDQTGKNTLKPVIASGVLEELVFFPPRLKMTRAHTQAHTARRGFGPV